MIKPKFNTGDKVWFYIPEENKFAWGIIQSITQNISAPTSYYVENRFWDSKPPSHIYYDKPKLLSYKIMSFNSADLYFLPEEIINHIKALHDKKLEKLTEKKKGLFG